MPPPQPSLEPGRFDRGYTIEGARNQYDPYGPVTVSFGEVRIFPKFQGLPVQETHGDDTYIRFLLSLGPMPLEIVPGSIKIGETEIDTFQGVEIETRLKPSDPPLTLYARDPFAEQVGATLTPEAGWITRTTAPAVTEIIAVIAFPLGLGGKNKKGNDEFASATVVIEYQPVSADPASGAWSSYRAGAPLVNDRLAELGEDRLRTNPFLDMAALESGYEQAGASSGPVTWRRKESGKPFQREVRFAVPQGQYRVRVRRTDPEIDDGRTANRVQFAQLISIAPTDPNPEPDHAVMAVRIKASDQLSGVVDTLNLVLRRIAPTLDPAILEADEPDLGLVTGEDWTATAVTASPVDAALFAMRGPMVVNPTPDDEIDWPAWAAFARWCKLKGYRFDYGLSGPMSRGDFVRLACAAGRARPVRINGKWSVVIDGPRPDGPRQLFTARNVSNFRVVRTFPGEVHALRVRFPNRFEGYREDERIVYFEGYSLDGSEPDTEVATKIEAFDLPGVTDPDQIYELARFFGATAMQQTERFSFDCDIEYLVSNYGDLVAIQHPVMVLGLGAGRIVEVETNASDAVIAITLDRTVEMIAGERYGLAWRRVIEPESGAARVEVQGAFEVDAVVGETARLVPVVPVSPADGPRPRPNDLVAFGHYGEETARALIKQITPRVGFEATVETVLEAPVRYVAGEGPIPTHNTALVTAPRRRPPSPELVSVNVTAEQIHISLSAPAGYEDRIVSIEASWRQSPDENAEARWIPLAPLGADSRVISFTPPDPAAEYDFQITAIDGTGRRSDPPLIVSQIAADNVIDPPRNVTAIGAVSVSANGVRQPVLQIAAEPDEDQTLTELLVEIRPSGSTELADFQPLAVLPPDRPNRDVRDIAPGATLDVGFRYRARRGERLIYSAYEIVEDVVIPDELAATDAVIPSQRIGRARDAINDALGSANEAFDEAAGQLAAVADTGARLSLKTWLRDPLFTGLEGWRVLGGVPQMIAGDPNALQAYWPFDSTGEQAERYLLWPVDQRISPNRYVQAACDVGVIGSVSDVILKVIWRDEAGDLISASEVARGSEGRISGIVQAPDGAHTVHIWCVPVTNASEGGAFFIRRPQAAYALPGQQDVDPFAVPGDELIARIETLERILGAVTEFRRDQLSENENAYSRVSRLVRTVADEDGALGQRIDQLDVSFGYQIDGLELAVQNRATITQLAQVEASAAGARALLSNQLDALTENLEDNYSTSAQVAQTFLAQSDLNGALATADLTVNAGYNNLLAKANVNVGAIIDINGRLASTFGVTLDANGNVLELYALADSTGTLFSFRADRFYIYDGSNPQAIFSAAGGVISMDQVEINGADIKALTVDTLQIKDNAISQTASATATSGTPQTSVTSSGGSVLVIASIYFQTLATAGQEHAIERQIGTGSWVTVESITGNPGNSLCLALVDQPGAAGQTLRYRVTSPTSTFLKKLAFLQIVK